MAHLLSRLGRIAYRKRWWFVSSWLVVLVAVGGAATTFMGDMSDSFDLPGTATQRTIDRMSELFPGAATETGTVVFETADGKPFSAAQRTAIGAALSDLRGTSQVTEALEPFQRQSEVDAAVAEVEDARAQLSARESAFDDGGSAHADGQWQMAKARHELERAERAAAAFSDIRFVSDDGTAALTSISFDPNATDISDESKSSVMTALDVLRGDGVNVYYSQEIATSFNSIFGRGEVIGIVIAAIVLLVTMGTLIAAGLPLLMAVIGVSIGVGGTLALSSLVEMSSITPMLALMLGLAVGIDYTLFIVHRHRVQLLEGMGAEESASRAIGTSGNAVVFAGSTVVIALAALIVPGVPFLSILGLSAAATVAVAVVVSLTLTPALLGFIGTRLLSRRERARLAGGATTRSRDQAAPAASAIRPSPWARLTSRRAWLVSVASVVLLAFISVPAASMRTALPDGSQEPAGSTAHLAFTKTAEHFGAGYNGVLVALAELPPGRSEGQADEALLDVADHIRAMEGVFAVTPTELTADHSAGLIQIIPVEGPSAEWTENLVNEIRQSAASVFEETDARLGLAGAVTMQIDVSEQITAAVFPYLAIVVGLSLILLLLVFRSIVVPLLATGGFLLSLASAFGATVAVYQWGWFGDLLGVHQPGPIMSFLPILLTGILFGLAMDYQVFLVSTMRERFADGMDASASVRAGLSATAPVVTAAALIMGAVFAGFVSSELSMIRPIGFALAVGVLADAFIVRMTLTPALMTILKERVWYIPRWLDRVLPHLGVEGRFRGRAGSVKKDAGDDQRRVRI